MNIERSLCRSRRFAVFSMLIVIIQFLTTGTVDLAFAGVFALAASWSMDSD